MQIAADITCEPDVDPDTLSVTLLKLLASFIAMLLKFCDWTGSSAPPPFIWIGPRLEQSPGLAPTVNPLSIPIELNVTFEVVVPAATMAEVSGVPGELVFMLMR